MNAPIDMGEVPEKGLERPCGQPAGGPADLSPQAVSAKGAHQAQWTPGPWQFGHLGTEVLWIGPGYNQTPVAHVDHDMEYARDNSRANARLIAAAPDLFAACERIRDEKAPAYHDCIDNGEPECAWCAVFNALAKARGAA